MLKPTTQNIIKWWFAQDTPIRQYRLNQNPILLQACERVSQKFTAPSGATIVEAYYRSDKIAFANAVEKILKANRRPLTDTSG